MSRSLLIGAIVLVATSPLMARDPSHRWSKPYVGYNPPVRYPSGVYSGYAGSAYYLHDKIYPSPFPGYHWADATLFSTGPGSTYVPSYLNPMNPSAPPFMGGPIGMAPVEVAPTVVPSEVAPAGDKSPILPPPIPK